MIYKLISSYKRGFYHVKMVGLFLFSMELEKDKKHEKSKDELY